MIDITVRDGNNFIPYDKWIKNDKAQKQKRIDRNATAAMQGLVSDRGMPTSAWGTIMPDKLAEWVYDIAYAMEAEREKRI